VFSPSLILHLLIDTFQSLSWANKAMQVKKANRVVEGTVVVEAVAAVAGGMEARAIMALMALMLLAAINLLPLEIPEIREALEAVEAAVVVEVVMKKVVGSRSRSR